MIQKTHQTNSMLLLLSIKVNNSERDEKPFFFWEKKNTTKSIKISGTTFNYLRRINLRFCL